MMNSAVTIQNAVLKQQFKELERAGKVAAGIPKLLQVVKTAPGDAEALFLLSKAFVSVNNNQHAFNAAVACAKLNSEYKLDALNIASYLALKLGLHAEGFMLTRELMNLDANNADICIRMAHFCAYLRLFEAARKLFKKALDTKGDKFNAWEQYAYSLSQTGNNEQALEAYRQAQRSKPGVAAMRNILLTANYCSTLSNEQVFAIHKDFEAIQAAQPDITKRQVTYCKKKTIRIGYMSPDLNKHSVSYFLLPIIEHHDRKKFEIFCYHNSDKVDAVTEKFKQLADQWRDIHTMSDTEVADRIQQDEVDILLDLTGHAGKGRQGVLAIKPAPVQVNYLGYPNTIGMSSVDYRITDPIADPPGMTEGQFVEKLYRLPDTFLCYRPDPDAPDIAPCPEKTQTHITFGSFNHYPKITDEIISAWSKILNKVPESKLLLKSKILLDKDMPNAIQQRFESLGIAKERLVFSEYTVDTRSHLAAYDKVDIHLDTYPYNGTTTTCEALWQGVPTITLSGDNHRSRVSASIMTQIGLHDCIADSPENYVEKAVCLALDKQRRHNLRNELRAMLSGSPLMQEAQFTKEIEASYTSFIDQLEEQDTD